MKKNFLAFALLFAVLSSNAQVQFLKSVSYRGAFAPSPTAMWTTGWANWDPQNTTYASTTVNVNDSITTNTVWTKNNVYKLQGLIYVTNNATLTIEAGTVVRGDDATANSTLIITRGAKLYAVGTVSEPIVFTSNKAAGSRNPGDWGGVVLLGRATYNGAGGKANIEGIAAVPQTTFGGETTPNDNDNSGTLKYVRIEYGGYVFDTNKEINGLTLGAVGRGTTIDYVQCSYTNDDSFEWFGGTVNCAHLISYRGVDDEFDTDNGFSGSVQFCLGVRDPQLGDATWSLASGSSTSEGFESDNDATGSTNSPITKAIFSNMTFVGPLRGDASSTNLASIHPAFRRSARLRRNTQLKVINSILMDYPTGVFIDGSAAIANASAGTLIFANNIVAGNTAGRVLENGTSSTIRTWFGASSNDSAVSTSGILTTPYNFTSPDYRPATGSIALSGASFSNSLIAPYVIAEVANKNFVTPVTYRGAFAPAPTAMWTNGWANWDPQNTNYASTTVNVNDSITTNTTWTKNNVYKLQGLIYVTNNATLTIEAGTVIRGDATVANSTLIITRGAKLIANGTVSEPIVFTSNKAVGSRAPGDWGGVVLLGKATYNGAGGKANIEGIAAIPQTTFGGETTPNDDDNSGSLKYVRIEYGGYVFDTNKEINGLTLGAVGRGTTIDYVQCSYTNDDSFEWFGGTVNCAHLISYRGVDDEFDTDNGFSGSVQFCLGVRDPQLGDATWSLASGSSTSEGFESDNDATGSTNSPITKAIFSNMTFVGPLRGDASSTNLASIHPAYRRSARLRRNTQLKVLNSILMDYPTGVFIDGSAAIANATAGTLRFSNNLVAGNAAGRVLENGSSSTVRTLFGTSNNDSLVSTSGILTTPYNFTAPDYRPGISSPALTNYNFSDSVFNGLLSTSTCTAPSLSGITGVTCLPATTAGNTTYTVDSIPGATCTWTIPAGLAFVNTTTNKVIVGSTLTGSRTVTVRSLLTTTAVNGNITVVVTNSCGASASATLAVKKVGSIGKIVAVVGSADPCNGIGTGYSLTYSTAKVANADGYRWTSVGGTIISSNDTSAAIRFNKISAGSVSVRPYGFCGVDTVWGITKGLVVKTVLPGATGVISATTDACAGIGSGNSLGLKAVTSTNATTYVWSTTISGASIIASASADSVNVSFPNNFAAGAVAVKAGRVCGTDTFFTAPKSITFKTLLPVKPTAITSSTSLDPCSKLGSSETYTVAATANTTSYLWTATGTGATVSSTGTVNGVVDYATSFRSGSVAVRSQRACGTTTFSSAPISIATKVALPTTPVVTGLLTPCRNVTGIYKAASTNATSYTWTAATGLSINSQAVDSAIVTTSATFTKANLSVYATRACGTTSINSVSKISGLVRPAIGCAPGSRPMNENVASNLAELNEAAMVYPNPSRGGFTVTVKNQSKASMATIQIVNLYGQVIKTYNANNNNGIVNYTIEDAKLNSGLYFVRYTVGESTGIIKLNINN
ncbi:MAG: T9SS type A sorting domain-containing protein [Chitinophagaceae bacterium]